MEAEASLAGKTLGKDSASFSVTFPYGETDDGRPRPELLKQIAAASQGEYVPIKEWNEKTLDRIAANSIATRRRRSSSSGKRNSGARFGLRDHPGAFERRMVDATEVGLI